MIFYRANGDSLSLKFTSEGTLSTAHLSTTSGSKWDVSRHLPGLTQSVAEMYLMSFGFSLSSARIPNEASRLLESYGFTCEYFTSKPSEGLVLWIISQSDRLLPCPESAGVVLWDDEEKRITKVIRSNPKHDVFKLLRQRS